jgi:glycosyltransferase involved in cell wall biosynthesis
MDLTLVIPSYNRANLILQTIESALNQTKAFAEIIVVDDASTDDTLKKLEQFGDVIKVVASSKVGVQEARNIGVRMANTPFVTLCDSDDLLVPTHVERVGDWLKAHDQYDAVYTNHQVFNENGIREDTFSRAPRGFFDGADEQDGFLTNVPDLYVKTCTFQPLLVSGVTLSKDFYLRIGGFDRNFNGVPAEDWEFTLRVVKFGRVALSRESLTLIRRHMGNESKSELRQRLGEIAILEHAINSHGCKEEYKKTFVSVIDRYRLWAFEEAFGTKKMRLAASLFPQLKTKRHSIKFRIKSVIIRLYMKLTNHQQMTSHKIYAEAES